MQNESTPIRKKASKNNNRNRSVEHKPICPYFCCEAIQLNNVQILIEEIYTNLSVSGVLQFKSDKKQPLPSKMWLINSKENIIKFKEIEITSTTPILDFKITIELFFPNDIKPDNYCVSGKLDLKDIGQFDGFTMFIEVIDCAFSNSQQQSFIKNNKYNSLFRVNSQLRSSSCINHDQQHQLKENKIELQKKQNNKDIINETQNKFKTYKKPMVKSSYQNTDRFTNTSGSKRITNPKENKQIKKDNVNDYGRQYEKLKLDYNNLTNKYNELEKKYFLYESKLKESQTNFNKEKEEAEKKIKYLSDVNKKLKDSQIKQELQHNKLKNDFDELDTKYKLNKEELNKTIIELKRKEEEKILNNKQQEKTKINIIEKGITNLEYKNNPKKILYSIVQTILEDFSPSEKVKKNKNNTFDNEHFSIFSKKKPIQNEQRDDKIETNNTDNNDFVKNVQVLTEEKEKLKNEIEEMNEQKKNLSLILAELESDIRKKQPENLKESAVINDINNNKTTQKDLTDEEINIILKHLDEKYNITSIFEENDIKKAILKANGDEDMIAEILLE